MSRRPSTDDASSISIIELFGGIGAPRAALRNLGISARVLDYVEIDPGCVRTYNAIFSCDPPFRERSVVGYSYGIHAASRPDLLVHGSPCRDFSIMGRREGGDRGTGTRSSLMWETLRIIDEMGGCRPCIVLWENVKSVLHSRNIHTFTRYLSEMERLGYVSSYRVLDAMDFGLPRKRRRVYTVSVLGDEPFDFDRLERVPMRPIGDFLVSDFDDAYRVTRNYILDHIGEGKSYRVKVIDDHCETITTTRIRSPNSGVVEYGPGRYRYLTDLECWRLMGFSDEDYSRALSVTPPRKGKVNRKLYRQAGNSMPVPVLEALFSRLFPQPSSCMAGTGT